MFKIKNKIYSEAGKYILCNNIIGYEFLAEEEKDCVESDIDLSDLKKRFNSIYSCTDNKISFCLYVDDNYDSIKSRLIKLRYSNDDQIALILNKDKSNEDLEYFNKMQEWRTWAGDVAKKLMTLTS